MMIEPDRIRPGKGIMIGHEMFFLVSPRNEPAKLKAAACRCLFQGSSARSRFSSIPRCQCILGRPRTKPICFANQSRAKAKGKRIRILLKPASKPATAQGLGTGNSLNCSQRATAAKSAKMIEAQHIGIAWLSIHDPAKSLRFALALRAYRYHWCPAGI